MKLENLPSKYKNWNKKEISEGFTCETWILQNDNKKVIYQEYRGESKFQVMKKVNVTNKILQNTNCKQLPKVIEYKYYDDYAYLITEFKDGKMLEKVQKENSNFSINSVAEELVQILSEIHNIKIENNFGWIKDDFCDGFEKFEQYLKNELERLENILTNKIDLNIVKKIMEKGNNAIKEISQSCKYLKPTINWYDINPQNIIIIEDKNTYKINGFIDAGGARIGVREWDLAFIKMDVCKNEFEFNNILNLYENINGKINSKLLDALCTIVEIDDITFQMNYNVNLDKPYDSRFSDIILN